MSHMIFFKLESSWFKYSFPSLNVQTTKGKEPSLSYYLLLAGVGFIHFLRVLAQYKMNTSSSCVQILVAVSIFYTMDILTGFTRYKMLYEFTTFQH